MRGVQRLGVASCLLVASSVFGCGRWGFDPLAGVEPEDSANADARVEVSCVDLPDVSGPDRTSPCCGSGVVPGGTFLRNFDVATDGLYADPSFPATISDFRLDTYEVTIGRFQQFVAAGMGKRANPPPPGAGARPLNGLPAEGGWVPDWNTNLEVDTAALLAKLGASYESSLGCSWDNCVENFGGCKATESGATQTSPATSPSGSSITRTPTCPYRAWTARRCRLRPYLPKRTRRAAGPQRTARATMTPGFVWRGVEPAPPAAAASAA
jgi:hypothetical protein